MEKDRLSNLTEIDHDEVLDIFAAMEKRRRFLLGKTCLFAFLCHVAWFPFLSCCDDNVVLPFLSCNLLNFTENAFTSARRELHQEEIYLHIKYSIFGYTVGHQTYT